MLHIYTADHVAPLAKTLAEHLKVPLADPMAQELVIIPTMGMSRWLSLELARTLGATGTDRNDGVSANIKFAFPGHLTRAVLDATSPGEEPHEGPNPWHVDRLAWVVLEVLANRSSDAQLERVCTLPLGATLFGRARRIADLFDRYIVRRPHLILQWVHGTDVDVTGADLIERDLWQPHLFRLVRERIVQPSPAERLPALLGAIESGDVQLDLPQRLSVFGLTTLPNGEHFIDIIAAISAHHELHLMMLDPSHGATDKVLRSTGKADRQAVLLRANDRSGGQILHPLLRSWGRPYRERAILLASVGADRLPKGTRLDSQRKPADNLRLLQRLQHDLRSDIVPTNDFELEPDDRSVQVHSCHGRLRQVEVMRDAILHLLARDTTLREEDIVVLCPDIDGFAHLVKAGFGTSAEKRLGPTRAASPQLLYRVADRSLRDSVPVLAALGSLLDLVSSRCTATEVFDFMSLEPVALQFGFGTEALRAISTWLNETNVCWGLDDEHRSHWGLPTGVTNNSWQSAVDRILMGVALSDTNLTLGSNGIAPLEVEEGTALVAGSFAEFVSRLIAITNDLRDPRTVDEWCQSLTAACDALFTVRNDEQFQMQKLRSVIAAIADEAVTSGEPSTAVLKFGDIKRAVSDRLQGAPQRTDFFRGGITVTSLTPLRWLPYRVVCILGLDSEATSRGSSLPEGDDLTAASPQIGDRDPRSETRQSLLEAVLVAESHLIITIDGHDIQTNNAVPPSVVFAELRDTIEATLLPRSDQEFVRKILRVHPRQAFDATNFVPDACGVPGPWGFDSVALAGARARSGQDQVPRSSRFECLETALADDEAIQVSALAGFLAKPVDTFAKSRLGIAFPTEAKSVDDELPIGLDSLEMWSVRKRLLDARIAGQATETWGRHEAALGTLPVGGYATGVLRDTAILIDALLDLAAEAGTLDAQPGIEIIDTVIGDTRLVGEIEIRTSSHQIGPSLITCTKLKPSVILEAWVELLALIVSNPDQQWSCVLIGLKDVATKPGVPAKVVLRGRGASPEERHAKATAALRVVLDCANRGMREPTPLFARFSYKLHKEQAKRGDWSDGGGRGELGHAANNYFFGAYDYDEIVHLPALDHDPAGDSPYRAQRFADYLWNAFDLSCEGF